MSTSFERTKPIGLFETTWESEDLNRVEDAPDVGDMIQTITIPDPLGGSGHTIEMQEDVWGVKWEKVPDSDWNDHLSVRHILKYEISYLRFRLTVLGGVPGDSVLFVYNAPNITSNSGLHAYTHLQIPSFGNGEDTADVNRASTVSNNLIKGYSYAERGSDPESRIKTDTEVSLYGVGKTDNISISAQCTLIGGFKADS